MSCGHTFTCLSLQDWHPVLVLCGLFVYMLPPELLPFLLQKGVLLLMHVRDNTDTDDKQGDA